MARSPTQVDDGARPLTIRERPWRPRRRRARDRPRPLRAGRPAQIWENPFLPGRSRLDVRALVTGGLGFVGSHLVELLLARGDEVTIIDRVDPRVHRSEPPLPRGVDVVRSDVREPFEGRYDVVFHQAAMVGVGRGAEDAAEFLDVNARATAIVMHSAARSGAKRVVLASTMAIYGEGAYECPSCQVPRPGTRVLATGAFDPACGVCSAKLRPKPCSEDHPPRPATPYAISKLAQEQIAMSVGREIGMPVVALRYHNVYGDRMPRNTPYSGVAALFRSLVDAGLPPIVHEDGGQMRDFVRVEDVARANLLASSAPADAEFEAFNIGTGKPRTILELARALCEGTGLVPRLAGTWRDGDARHVFASIDKARKGLAYEPSISFEAGVERFRQEACR